MVNLAEKIESVRRWLSLVIALMGLAVIVFKGLIFDLIFACNDAVVADVGVEGR